jgi:hypothetical protein
VTFGYFILLLLVATNAAGQIEDNCCRRLVGGGINSYNLPKDAIDNGIGIEKFVTENFDLVFIDYEYFTGSKLSKCQIEIDFFGTQNSTGNQILDDFYNEVLKRDQMLDYVFIHSSFL